MCNLALKNFSDDHVPVQILLPWPPSVNSYYRHLSKGRLAGRTLISKDGRVYREKVAALVESLGMQTMDCRLAVTIEANPPDRRRRDLDNLLKSLLDALVSGGAMADDSLIDHLTIFRGAIVPGGQVVVDIEELDIT